MPASKPRHEDEPIEYDANGDVVLASDRFFDPWREARSEALMGTVREAQKMITDYERRLGLRERARRPKDQAVFEQTIEALICDMMAAHLSGDERGSAITLSNSILGTRSRYRSPVFSKQLPDILKAMASPEMGYIRVQVGWRKNFGNRGQRTLIWPSKRTIRLIREHTITLKDIGRRPSQELIILKAPKQSYGDEAQYLDYDDTPAIAAMRAQVAEINEWLEKADLGIAHPDLAARVSLTDRRLRRVFTRGSFESGGRLYGGFWQQMKKDDRHDYIVINGDGVVGLDFGQIAARIAYGLVGAKPPEGDLYQIDGFHPCYRAGFKVLLNSVLSSEKPLKRKPRRSKDLLPPQGLSSLLDALAAKHAPIAPLFFTAACHQIQFVESQIMVEILLRLKREGIVGLPIHDGVVVPWEAEDKVCSVMEAVALEKTGVNIPVSVE